MQTDFYLADVTRLILSVNFFIAHNVAIDLRGRRLVDLTHGNAFDAAAALQTCTLSGLRLSRTNSYEQLLLQCLKILSPQFQGQSNKHGVQHHILTRGLLSILVHAD